MDHTDPSAIKSLGSALNAEEEKAQAREAIQQTYAQSAEDRIGGVLPFNSGDTYTVSAGNGVTDLSVIGPATDRQGNVVPDNVVVRNADGTQAVMPKEQIQKMSDAAGLMRVAMPQQKEDTSQDEDTPAQPSQYNLNDDVDFKDENGKTVYGRIVKMPVNNVDDSVWIDYFRTPEERDAGRPYRSNALPVEEFNRMWEQSQEAEEKTGDGNIPQENIPENGNIQQENIPENAAMPQVQEDQETPTAVDLIPKDEQGNLLYEQADPGVAWDAIVEQAGGDEEMARSVADSMVKDKEAALKKAEKAPLRSGGNVAEKLQAERERKEAVAQAQAERDHWKAIAETPERREAEAQSRRQAEAERGEQERIESQRPGSNEHVTDGERTESGKSSTGGADRTVNDIGNSRRERDGGDNQKEEGKEKSAKEQLTKEEAASIIADMEEHAEAAPEIELTTDNWNKLFGEDGTVDTPLGRVKMGKNQFAKMMRKGRSGKLGMIKPTLEKPDIIIEDRREAKDSRTSERETSHVFVKFFVNKDGLRYYYFTSITVSQDGKEVVVSNQEKSRNRVLRLMSEGSVIWRTPKDAAASSAEKQGLDYAHPNKAEDAAKGSGITPQSTASVSKDTKHPDNRQEKAEKFVAPERKEGEDLFDYASRIVDAQKRHDEEQKVDRNPTEAQKEAGNYKKGHIKLDGYDITIENPKGSVRSGVDGNGKKWETKMHNTYGYLRGTEGVDGDHIDVFLSDKPDEGNVYVVDRVNPETGEFDEHKVMYGFPDEKSARAAYLSNYSTGWKGLGAITEVSKEKFKKWIDSSRRKTKPFAEYRSVKADTEQRVDNQGNPVDTEGRLIVERVNSIDEITDKDFTDPTRNVELPKIPDNVDNAIGAEGKPVVIKKNIFERNAERHNDLLPQQGRDIIKAALYNPSLYGQNQKSKRPHNWVLINVSDKEYGDNKLVLLETNRNKDNVEIVHWHYVDKRGLEKIKRQAEREDGQLLILPSENTEEVGALSDPTHGMSSVSKDSEKDNSSQTGSGKSSEKLSEEDRKAVKEVLHYLAPKANIASLTDEQIKEIAQKERTFQKAEDACSVMAQKHEDEALNWLDENYPGSGVVTAGNRDLRNKAKSDPRYKELLATQQEEMQPLTTDRTKAFKELSDTVERYTGEEDVLYREGDDAYTEEEQGIIDNAKRDGTYMKAPNGKKTRLTEKQWVQVRTQAFKKWFGDWEKTVRIEKQRKSKAVKITGDEIEPSDDLKQYKKNALEYGTKLQGSYVNKDTGHEIQLQRGRRNGGVNEVLQHDYKDVEHLQSVAAIPQLIENGIYITSRENTAPEKNPNVKEYQYYACGLKINGTDYTVRFTVAEDKNGNRYYDHKLTRIEKGKLLDLLKSQAVNDVGFGTTPGTKPTTDISSGKDKVLFSILQSNSSKVVDENGEPMVVYHGTLAKDLTRFKKDMIGSRNSYDDKGFFFISNKNVAHDYSLSEFDSSKQGSVIDAFVSLHNPLVVDSKWCRKYGLGSSVFNDNDVIEFWDNYQSLMLEESEDNDGVVIADGKDTMVVAFEPNQVKSATGNSGNFSKTDDDIRYREDDGVSSFASEHGLKEEDVRKYADSMRRGSLGGATFAFMAIRRSVRLANRGKSLGEFTKRFSPVKKELYERFGSVDELKERSMKEAERERGLMAAARRRAEADAEAERKRLQEFESMTDGELDAAYAKAVEAGDGSRMRDLVNEAARRNGYGDAESTYQGVGAWSAPSNPGYESDAERRADVEENSPDVNVTDMAEGYTLQPDNYFTNLRAYGNDTPHGRESAEAINKAMAEVREGKNPMIKVYRAVPTSVKEGKLRNGDWVTPSRKYAEMHGNSRLEGKYRIMEQEVPADELWWDGNDINEWGFDDGKRYAYRNTRNNR
ncbi:MAG: hypothetical protein LUC45_03570, partial [Paraprevotella sp.]|nr:hypothetical protein [Paraprevotella sp.]